MVHVSGGRSVLMSILKNGNASTLDVVGRVREILPTTLARLPKELKASLLFDQSVFVRAAVSGVVKEAAIAALLTALMILLFLGSWRSTLIVVVSIPLSILVSIIALRALGHTLNVMTLGGMALAVGILVDDATVSIENIHRNMGQHKPFIRAIVDGAQEIAVPAFVSTLCICIVFVPVAFIAGAAKSLFVPLALAVVFAMLTSYFLSRTLVPTLVRFLLEKEANAHGAEGPGKPGWARRFFSAFDRWFVRLRTAYGGWLAWALEHRAAFVCVFLSFVALTVVVLVPLLGRDFFPSVDAGLIKLHVRGAPGLRIEETEKRFAAIEDTIRTVIPPAEISTLLDNLGVPNSGLNLSLSEGALISPADGQILIALKEGHRPTADYVRKIRRTFRRQHAAKVQLDVPGIFAEAVLQFFHAHTISYRNRWPHGHRHDVYAIFSVSLPFSQLQGHSSSVCNASSTRITSFTLRPTFRSVTITKRMTPSGSMTYVARCATPSAGSSTPSAVESSRLMSASIGKGKLFSSSLCWRHARCTNSESVLTPSTCASRSLNALFSFPNSAISVGHTKVKSFGQKNSTSHLPG
jgi:multidrug efflux pump subunit AcrB